MKSEHIKIFSYLTKSYTLQKDEVETSRGILVVDLVNNKGKLEDLETAEVAKKLISKYNISLSIINFYSRLLANLKNSDNTSLLGSLLIDDIALDNYILEQEKYHHLLYDYFDTVDDTSLFKNREREKELSASIEIQEKKLQKKIKKYKEVRNE
ncbi:unknown [Clostridium sp. CAG:451]|nr:unknown [Clostridium sp. CAG:451]